MSRTAEMAGMNAVFTQVNATFTGENNEDYVPSPSALVALILMRL